MLSALAAVWSSDLALDLGTARTRLAAPRAGVVVDEPSLVALEQATRRVAAGGLAVGELARQMLGRAPDAFVVDRPLRDGAVADLSTCEAMLGSLLRRACGGRLRLPPRVLVALPARLTPVERQVLFLAVRRAGARRVWGLEQAKAAALGAGLPVAEPEGVMVCNLGSASTELAVLSVGQVVASAAVPVGGAAFDAAVAQYLRRQYALRISLAAAEELRRELGTAWPVQSERYAEVAGFDVPSKSARRVCVSSEEIRQALADPLTELAEALVALLDRAGPELAADVLRQGVVLVGGGSRLRGLDRFLTEHAGVPVRLAPEPELAVVRGLAACLEQLSAWQHALRSDPHA
jgi:rod shape-determining protein MreB